MYGSEKMLQRHLKKLWIKAEQLDSLSGLLGIKKIDRIPNARVREFGIVKKGVDERIDESVL